MMEENVVSAAGTTYCLTEELICHLIRTAGFIPAQRDNRYRLLSRHQDAGPDLRVEDWSTQRIRRLHVETASAAPTGGALVQLPIAERAAGSRES
jgi:cyclic dehypoxanthinyl futalosine synthase